MQFYIMTLFPEMVMQGLSTSIIGRAVNKGLLSIEAVNIRDYAFNKHSSVDDYPYGGGAGMLMQAEPVYQCYRALEDQESSTCLRREKPLIRRWRKNLHRKRSWYSSAVTMKGLTRECLRRS